MHFEDDYKPAERGGRGLKAAWLCVLMAIGATAGWLYWQAEETETRHVAALPSLTSDIVESSTSRSGAAATSDIVEEDSASDEGVEPPRATLDTERPAPEPPLSAGSDLVETSPFGPLPVTRGDRAPWIEYARASDPGEQRPRVAIIVTELGLQQTATDNAIRRLPADITLAFSPYAEETSRWMADARSAGHEVLLSVPMEPSDFPSDDPGPRALLASLSDAENRERLHWSLSRGSEYVGVANFMGSRFVDTYDSMRPVMEDLAGRGLLYIDIPDGERSLAARLARELEMPYLAADTIIDDTPSRSAIDAALDRLTERAVETGFAVGVASSYPVTFERLTAWAPTLAARGVVLAPVTALASVGGAGDRTIDSDSDADADGEPGHPDNEEGNDERGEGGHDDDRNGRSPVSLNRAAAD